MKAYKLMANTEVTPCNTFQRCFQLAKWIMGYRYKSSGNEKALTSNDFSIAERLKIGIN